MKKIIVITILSILFFSCNLFQAPKFETWDHVVSAANYSIEGTLYKYTYTDERFNQTDWYDIYLNNSYWKTGLGWGHLDIVFDSGVFYYQALYYDGYVEWYTYGEDLVGATLRFYKLQQ